MDKIEKLIEKRANVQKLIANAIAVVKHINERLYTAKPQPSTLQLPSGWSVNQESLDRARLAVTELNLELLDLDEELEPLLTERELKNGQPLAVATQRAEVVETFTTALEEVERAKSRYDAAMSALLHAHREAVHNSEAHIEERRAAGLPSPPAWPRHQPSMGSPSLPVGVVDFMNAAPKRDTSRRNALESERRRQRGLVSEYDEQNQRLAEAAEKRRVDAEERERVRTKRIPGLADISRMVFGGKEVPLR